MALSHQRRCRDTLQKLKEEKVCRTPIVDELLSEAETCSGYRLLRDLSDPTHTTTIFGRFLVKLREFSYNSTSVYGILGTFWKMLRCFTNLLTYTAGVLMTY